MKRLKSSLEDLRSLFEKALTVSSVAEPLKSFDINKPAIEALTFMNTKDFDVIGVKENDRVIGYAKGAEIKKGTLRDYMVQFNPRDLLMEETSLAQVFEALCDSPRKFVKNDVHVEGIVTRGDMQKIPVRMWLFGLVSLIEMQMLRLIREFYQGESSWKNFLSEERQQKAKDEFDKRKRRKEETDLADCLQFGDKHTILLKNREVISQTQLDPKRSATTLFELEKLRNKLAHSQELVAKNWPKTVELVTSGVAILQKLEKITRLDD